MSIQVKTIDEFGIMSRLRKSKIAKDKEVLQYIKSLKEALRRQQDLTELAINALREATKNEQK